jgi:hypothetical protein
MFQHHEAESHASLKSAAATDWPEPHVRTDLATSPVTLKLWKDSDEFIDHIIRSA